jgi:hypothetical protein
MSAGKSRVVDQLSVHVSVSTGTCRLSFPVLLPLVRISVAVVSSTMRSVQDIRYHNSENPGSHDMRLASQSRRVAWVPGQQARLLPFRSKVCSTGPR